MGVEVLAISTDSHHVHKAWQDHELSRMVSGGVPFPLLSDAGGRVGQTYGVYDEEAGVDIRGRFLIDPDSVLQSMEVLPPPVGRDVDEMVRQVQAFQHVRATGEVAPCAWHPGAATLKTGPQLVGRVWKTWKLPKARRRG
jgi:peroxiredoxin (alkyl hydroperoxide reductase subunit C)